MTRVYYTPEISLPAAVKFADCHPTVTTSNDAIAHAYIVEMYPVRSAWEVFDKGPTPPPFYFETSLDGNSAYYSIYFNNFTASNCPEFSCNLQCLTQDITINQTSGSTANFSYCANGEKPRYFFTAEFSSNLQRESTPAIFNFSFVDQLYNTKELTVNSISFVKPLSPTVVKVADQGKPLVYLGVPFRTINHTKLTSDDIDCLMVQKSYNGLSAPETLVSWIGKDSNYHEGIFTDRQIETGNVYNYRIKYKNTYKEETQWSDWATIALTGSSATSITWST